MWFYSNLKIAVESNGILNSLIVRQLSMIKFHTHETIYERIYDIPANPQVCERKYDIVALDMDGTLINPASKRKFPKDRADWKWWDVSVHEELRQLSQSGTIIVIFSNQAGIEKKKQKADDIAGKIIDIEVALNVNMKDEVKLNAMFATATDRWRKPHTTMWDRFVEVIESRGVVVDKSRCCYVGDAAGRIKGWKRNGSKDFGCSDRAFAHNIGITFFTPEEFFTGEEPTPHWNWGVNLPEFNGNTPVINIPDTPEIIVTVGCPASGKSTLAMRYFVPHGYVRINRDTLGTAAKCIAKANAELKDGKSIIVDNTSPDIASRSQYVLLAQKYKVGIRCIWVSTDIVVAHHLNIIREVSHGVRRIPNIVYAIYQKKFVQPSVEEGFSEVIKVDFTPTFDHHDVMTPELFGMATG